MAKRKPMELVADSALWSSIAADLLKNTPGALDLSHDLIAGPLVDRNPSDPRFVLITSTGGQCVSRSASLSSPQGPVLTKAIDCGQASAIHRAAVVPAIFGYSELSTEGRKQLESLTDTKWQLARTCYFHETDGARDLRQQFRFWLPEGMKEFESATWADAFSDRQTFRRSDWAFLNAPVLALREKVLGGGARKFMIWVGPAFNLHDARDGQRMEFAAVAPFLLNGAPERTVLFPGERICVGSSCRSLEGFEFTRYVSYQYLVLTFDPSRPGYLELELHHVAPETPVLAYSLDKEGPGGIQ